MNLQTFTFCQFYSFARFQLGVILENSECCSHDSIITFTQFHIGGITHE